MLDLAERPDPPHGPRRPAAWPCCSRSRRSHPQLHARWPSSSSAATRSRSGATRSASTSASRSRTSPDAGRLPRRHRRPGCSTTPCSSAWPRSPTVPVVNLLSDDAHPCQALADLLTMRQQLGDARRAARSPGSATSTTSPGRWPSAAAHGGHGGPARLPAGLRPDRRRPRPAARPLGRRAAVVTDRPARGGRRAPTPSTPTCGPRWARRTRPRPGAGPSRASRSTTRLMAGAAARRRLPALPAAHRGEEVSGEVVDGPQSRVWPQAAQPPARRPGPAGAGSLEERRRP